MRLDGKWEGKLLDVSGPVALVTLHLKAAGERLAGDFAAYFVPPDESCGCEGGAPRLAQSGPVTGRYDAKTNRARLSYDLTIGLKPVTVNFDGAVRAADPHARRAIVGCYEVSRGSETLTLEGGGCVLWLYADSPPTRTRGRA